MTYEHPNTLGTTIPDKPNLFSQSGFVAGVMAKISDSLRLFFETSIEDTGDRYVLEIPDALVDDGSLSPETLYRVALLAGDQPSTGSDGAGRIETPDETTASPDRTQTQAAEKQAPPVEEGDIRTVTIDTLGDQGDGIAKVERGFIVIVSDTDPGDQLDVEITNVKDTVAFAEPIAE